MTDLEIRLHEKYFKNEILDADDLDNDPNKIYKLVVMSRLFDSRISEDLRLLHHIEKMYGQVTLSRILDYDDTGSGLLASIFPESFGYDIAKRELQFSTSYLNSSNEVENIVICTSQEYTDSIIIDNLRCWDTNFWSYHHINSIPQYASLTLEFIKHYMEWSETFHKYLDWSLV